MKTLNLIITAALLSLTTVCFSATNSKMSGTYTIGYDGKFSSLSEALSALEQNGADGSITFVIDDNTYSQEQIMSAISETSVTANITFVTASEQAAADKQNDNKTVALK